MSEPLKKYLVEESRLIEGTKPGVYHLEKGSLVEVCYAADVEAVANDARQAAETLMRLYRYNRLSAEYTLATRLLAGLGGSYEWVGI